MFVCAVGLTQIVCIVDILRAKKEKKKIKLCTREVRRDED